MNKLTNAKLYIEITLLTLITIYAASICVLTIGWLWMAIFTICLLTLIATIFTGCFHLILEYLLNIKREGK